MVFVAHCVLNQNAKVNQCAHYPGVMRELAEYLVESGLGIVQMPCPELTYLGLDRQMDTRMVGTVESEDTRIAVRMRESAARSACSRLVEDIAYQMGEYRKNGFEVVGILGINGSPTCGVETNWSEDKEAPGAGVFLQALGERLENNGMVVPIRGVKAANPSEAVFTAKQLTLSRPLPPEATRTTPIPDLKR